MWETETGYRLRSAAARRPAPGCRSTRVGDIRPVHRSAHSVGAQARNGGCNEVDLAELESRWVDVSYRDLVENPMSVVSAIYERLD